MPAYIQGVASYIVLMAFASHPFIEIPMPYKFIFDVFFLLWLCDFLVCCVVVFRLYRKNPISEAEAFRLSIILIISSSVLVAFAKPLANRIQQFIDGSVALNNGPLQLLSIGFETLQQVVGFGLAALGANIAASIITSRWKKHG